MKQNLIYIDMGHIAYQDALQEQEKLFQTMLDYKLGKTNVAIDDHILFCEHLPVYTLGKSGSEANLLKQGNTSFFKTNRGGDITYHGPGQITVYPILDLERKKLSVAEYIFLMEECIIQLLKQYFINGSRLSGASGVWIDADNDASCRKICAIGVKTSRYITMHGFAFNVNTDLAYFNNIIPCGIADKGVTSLAKELGREIPLHTLKIRLLQSFCNIFSYHTTDFSIMSNL